MVNKVSVIGGGNVGATVAQYVAEKELADVVLIDKVEGLAKGKSLDLMAAGPVRGFDSIVRGNDTYDETSNSDIIVITAGLARKPGMTREDLLAKNAEIIKDVTEQVSKRSPESIIIMVTNPLDIMTYLSWEISGFPDNRVIGMAGVLDSARFRFFVSEELGVSVNDIHALVLGGHGDSMVPLPEYCTVSGVPISKLIKAEKIDAIIERTRNAGAEVVSYLKTGSAYYSPAASAVEMVEAILKDKKRLLPCGAFLRGEYGLEGIFMGVPVVLGRNGVEKILEIPLSDDEMKALKGSADIVKTNIEKLKI